MALDWNHVLFNCQEQAQFPTAERFGKAKTANLTNFQTFLNFRQKKKNRCNFKIICSKLVHRKGCFRKLKKNLNFSSLIYDSRNILAASLQ